MTEQSQSKDSSPSNEQPNQSGWENYSRWAAGIASFALFFITIVFVLVNNARSLGLLISLPLALISGYFAVVSASQRRKVQDWLTEYTFGVTAVVSAWIIGGLLILWVIVTLVWGPRDELTVHTTISEQPRITVAHPRVILADGKLAEMVITTGNETAVVQTTTLTITKSPTLPLLFVENPQAMIISRTWTVSPTMVLTDVVELVNDGGGTAVFRQPVSFIFSTPGRKDVITLVEAEEVPGIRLRQFVNSAVNEASPFVILIAFLVPSLSAIVQQMIKSRKETRKKEAEDQQEREKDRLQRQLEESVRKMQELIEQTRRQIRLGNMDEANQHLSIIKKEISDNNDHQWGAQVQLIDELLSLAMVTLTAQSIDDVIEKSKGWPNELIACYLIAWKQNNDKECHAALIKARRLLPAAQISSELQDGLAMVELEIVQREKEMGEFKPVLSWPQPPQHRGVGVKPVSPFIARRILNGRDPFAHEYAEDELPDLFADETKLAFWGGHSLFNALFTVDRVTLVHSVPGNGRTAFAYGLHYFASRREVFALHIPGQPDAQEIQRRYALHLCDFVLAYPGHLRRIAAAEMNLLAHLLATQIGKTVILGRIQSRQVALSARQQTNETKQEHLSARTQLQLLAQKVEAVSPKQDNAVDWVMNGLGTIVYALGFKRAFLILDANTPDSAKYMIETLLPQGLRWQASGFYTIFFLPSTLSLTEPQPRGEFYSWSLTWSLAQIEKAIAWRYRAFTAPKRKILEQFENKDSFDFMLQQCSYNAENLSFIPRKFIQLWHNVTDVLQPDGEITRAAIEQFSRASTHVMPPQAKESDQTEQPITGQVSSETISDPDRETAEQKQLKHILNNYFKLSELQEICFDFGVDYEEFSDRKSQMSLDMVTHFKNSNRLDDLWTAIQKQRPFVRE